jgi:hypothetical protein
MQQEIKLLAEEAISHLRLLKDDESKVFLSYLGMWNYIFNHPLCLICKYISGLIQLVQSN